jgi:hypothetical protein
MSHQEIKFIISLNVNKLLKINYENIVKIYLKIFFFLIKYQKIPLHLNCLIKYRKSPPCQRIAAFYFEIGC